MLALLALVATLQLTAKDSQKTFTVKPRTAIVITLASNPSTGYHWEYLKELGSRRYVRLVSHRYVAPPVNRPGAVGKEIWRFRAISGTAPINLAYFRSRRDPVKKSFSVTIRVR